MKITNYLLIGIAIMVCSCQKEDTQDLGYGDGVLKTEKFVYQDENYAIDYYQINDSIIRIETPEDSKDYLMYDLIMSQENVVMATFSDEPDWVYYFDNENERQKFSDRILRKSPSQLKAWTPLQLYIYEHESWKGTRYMVNDANNDANPSNLYNGFVGYGNLGYASIGLDNRISSIKVHNQTGKLCEISLYEHGGYSGTSWTIYVRPKQVDGVGDSNADDLMADRSDYTIYQLSHFTARHLRTTGVWPFKKEYTWNDQVSSIKWKLSACENAYCFPN